MKNPGHVCHGVKSVTVNGSPINITNGAYINDQAIAKCVNAQVTVVMGWITNSLRCLIWTSKSFRLCFIRI